MIIILEIAKYASAVIVIATALGMFIKWAIVKPMKIYIDQATKQIHPDSNGGRSLNDIAQTVLRIESNVKDLDYRLNNIEELVTKPPTRTKKTAIESSIG